MYKKRGGNITHKKKRKRKKNKKKNLKRKKVINLNKNIIRVNSYKKSYYILSSLISIFIIILLISILTKVNNRVIFNYGEYNIGDKIILNDKSEWYCIKYTNDEEENIHLISSNILDINNDFKIDDNDKKVFDLKNKNKYSIFEESNIGYFLSENKNTFFKNISDIKEIRLLSSNEYVTIRNEMEFGYDWNEGNWLANEILGRWWLETNNNDDIYVVTERGNYRLVNPNSEYFVRPVIVVDKNIIKNK